jgi:hypothetical protein
LVQVAVPRSLRSALTVAFIVALTACGSCSTSPSSTPSLTAAPLHVDVTDPVGDTAVDGRVAIPPDLARATVDVSAGTVTFVIQFAAGTLDRQTTRVTVLLDVDRNASTGISQGNGLGADFGLDLFAATGQGVITKADPIACAAGQSCFTPVSSVSIVVGTDSMQVVVPLTMLGGTDGRMCFQINSYVLFGVGSAVIFDFMPNSGVLCLE